MQLLVEIFITILRKYHFISSVLRIFIGNWCSTAKNDLFCFWVVFYLFVYLFVFQEAKCLAWSGKYILAYWHTVFYAEHYNIKSSLYSQNMSSLGIGILGFDLKFSFQIFQICIFKIGFWAMVVIIIIKGF